MSITIEDVKHVAKLARLEFTERELEAMTKDMSQIVGYVEKLGELDVSGVEATAHVLDLKNVFREDVQKTILTQEQALANAPKAKKGHFSVPKVIG